MSNGSLSSSKPVARLCHVIQLKHFDGYGFNLHAEKGKPGQYIGKVDEGSPAEAAGLKQGDRIIEVNGVNISNENHKQVVQRIKAIPNETKLLVVDSEADKYYKANNTIIKSSLPDVLHLQTPVPNEDNEMDMNGEKSDGNHEDTTSQKSERSAASAEPEVKHARCIGIFGIELYRAVSKLAFQKMELQTCIQINMFEFSSVLYFTLMKYCYFGLEGSGVMVGGSKEPVNVYKMLILEKLVRRMIFEALIMETQVIIYNQNNVNPSF